MLRQVGQAVGRQMQKQNQDSPGRGGVIINMTSVRCYLDCFCCLSPASLPWMPHYESCPATVQLCLTRSMVLLPYLTLPATMLAKGVSAISPGERCLTGDGAYAISDGVRETPK